MCFAVHLPLLSKTAISNLMSFFNRLHIRVFEKQIHSDMIICITDLHFLYHLLGLSTSDTVVVKHKISPFLEILGRIFCSAHSCQTSARSFGEFVTRTLVKF